MIKIVLQQRNSVHFGFMGLIASIELSCPFEANCSIGQEAVLLNSNVQFQMGPTAHGLLMTQ